MKAYALTSFDDPPRFLDLPVPEPTDHEVLIRVQASSVNPVDAMVASGFFRSVQQYCFPAVFGRDLCGVVERIGGSVTRFQQGQLVWGFIKRDYIGDGTFADYVTSPENYYIAPKPPTISVLDAGVLGLSSITAQECLDALQLGPDASVLINGATGGVGSYAVQIAASRGLTVIATARPGAASDFVAKLGVQHVVDWTGGDIAMAVRNIAPDGVDGLVDLVRRDESTVIGMDETPAQRQFADFAHAVLRPGGRLSSVSNGANPDFLGDLVGTNVHSSPTPTALARINDLLERGAVRSPICATYPFSRLPDAFERQQHRTLGKVAVTVDPAIAVG